MSDADAAPAANDTPAPSPLSPAAPAGSTGDIAAMLGKRREQANKESATPEAAGAAPPESQEDNAAAVEEQPPGETDENDPAEEPSIDPPKSLSKAEKEAFAALPRELQEAWSTRERDRDAYYRKGHDEATAKARAAEQREQAAEQARQQYEQALPSLLQQFQAQVALEFQDVKTWDDVTEMQKNDPFRFQQWQIAVQKGEALKREADGAQKRQQEDYQQRLKTWQDEQQKLFEKAAPEYFDPVKAPKLWAETKAALKETGITDKDIDALWNGGSLPFHDHRTQLLLRDAARYRAAQKALKAAKPAPVPPVQRPGTATAKAGVSEAHIRDLTNKARESGAPRDIAALLTARRKAS